MRKDYLRMFVKLAKKRKIWYSVCADGTVDYITDTVTGDDFYPYDTNSSTLLRFGSKAAYDWLVNCIKDEGGE